jgi:DNA-binding transcriptional MerR regulator
VEGFLTIGEVARRTGLAVKTIRFYADRGIVPPTGRNAAGHRLYDVGAPARLELVRTLRELGIDLPAVRRIVSRDVSLAEVAAAHAEAVAAQIEVLRLRHAVLSAAARLGTTSEGIDVLRRLATMSERERQSMIAEFLDSILNEAGVRSEAGVLGEVGILGEAGDGIRTTMTPRLPDDPELDQVEAWVELAGLAGDPDFRARMRLAVRQLAGERSHGVPRPDLGARVRERVSPAVAAGLDPASPEADELAALLTEGDAAETLVKLEILADPRRDRYFELLAVINAWPPPVPLAPSLSWAIEALQARR